MLSGMPDCLANLAISSSLPSLLVALLLSVFWVPEVVESCGLGAFGKACKPFGEAFGKAGKSFGGDGGGLVLGSALGWFLRFLNIASTIVCLQVWLPVCLLVCKGMKSLFSVKCFQGEVNWRSNDCQGKVKASQGKVKGKSSEVNGGSLCVVAAVIV